MQVIRMITRLLFIWFLKEKNHVPSDLFDEAGTRTYLKNFDFETLDYYQAILQNLFFPTLNTPITERAFREPNDSDDTDTPTTKKSSRPVYNKDHRNSNKYRYVDLLQNGDTFLEHLKQVPFVNGGLFDSLDSFKGKRTGGKRVDCFTDWPLHRQRLHGINAKFDKKGDVCYSGISLKIGERECLMGTTQTDLDLGVLL